MKKIIVSTSTIVIVILLIAVCIKRWNAWFGNPEEPVYNYITEPGRIQLTFGNDGEFSRNISWQCGDSLIESKVALAQNTDTTYIQAQGKLFETKGGKTVSYHAVLNNLNEGIYSYSVRTGNNESDWYEFKVNNPTDKLSFVYLGDIQDTINGITKQFVSDIYKKEQHADFWVLGGDVIERPHDQYWNEYFKSMDSISQTIPVIAIPGNHEYLKGITRRLEERFVYTFSYFVQSQYKGHTVYNLQYGNTAIITLDSNKDPWTLFSQRKWLKKALEQAENAKWKVVVLHHPIYSIKGKVNNLTVRLMFNSLIKKHKVDLVLQGHEHGYARMISKDSDDTFATPVYMVGQSSPKDYRLYFNDKYDRYGNGKRFYQNISINGDSLLVKSYTDTNKLYDDICIIKKENNIQIEDRAIAIPEQIEVNSRSKRMNDEKLKKYEEDISNWLAR
ncbi:metallophosphoesterase family protein [Paludibacter sp. 221]|uniref:metallophosphoesterase family protein n=1 Tax=Paludibacter sp. 221 TaxID=2302939 RepID=UPI0013CF915E|nr:metallophosphoesterase [Paludibacter sp. 221]NDV46891.1 metallophosphoesterase family protein [Paludibacter sp. 221]